MLLTVILISFPSLTSFSAHPSHCSLSFSSSGLTTWFPRLLLLLLRISVFIFFSFSVFTLLVVVSVRLIKPTHVGCRAHVSYRRHFRCSNIKRRRIRAKNVRIVCEWERDNCVFCFVFTAAWLTTTTHVRQISREISVRRTCCIVLSTRLMRDFVPLPFRSLYPTFRPPFK